MTQNPVATTLYIRCAGLHSRGELLNDFFYAHRNALGLENYYEATTSTSGGGIDQDAERATASSSADAPDRGERVTMSSCRLPADFPVEVVFVRQSRKPYFLVEWRYPTHEEVDKQRAKDASAAKDQGGEGETAPLVAETNNTSSPSSTANRLPSTLLAELAERTLALGRRERSEDALMWRGEPVTISAALAGMTVAAERTKLELRDAQLKTQRVAEKRARDEAEAAAGTAKKPTGSEVPTSAFVPRSVRRRA